MAYEFKNPRYNDDGTIDCDINHPSLGWIPTTLNPADVNQECLETLESVIASGGIEPYTPPSAEEIRAAMPDLTRKQFRLGMRDLGVTSSMIDAAIATITDENEREIAQIEWEDSDRFHRSHPLISQLMEIFGKSDEQVDAAWMNAVSYL